MLKQSNTLAATLLACAAVTTTQAAPIPNLGDDSCDSLLLVSSWNRNNVKIYDGCSGEFIRDLDSQNLIDGPLGILQAPDGDLLVLSESNNRLLKFDRQTLSIGSAIMEVSATKNNFISSPAGAVIDDDGFMYAASYGTNKVVKIDTSSWSIVDEMLPASNGLIEGIDAGLAISDDGHLYIPGYDSDNILKLNLQTKEATVAVATGAGGLDAPRTILLRGEEIVVTAQRSNAIMVFDVATGAFKQTLIEVSRPTGLMQDGDNHFLVNTSSAVYRVTNDGLDYEKVVQNGAGDLLGGTFVYRMKKTGVDSDGGGDTTHVLQLSGTPTTSIAQDASYSFTPDVSYTGDLTTLSFSISNQPQWTNFDQTNGKLSGTPGNSDVGNTTDIVITVTTGAEDIALTAFDLTVTNVNDAPTLVSEIGQQSYTEGDSISLDISSHFNDIDALDSLTFSADGLPAGITISEMGVISGTVSAADTTSISVTATDVSGAAASATFDLHVQGQDPAPAPAPVTPVVNKSSSGGGSTGGGLLLMLSLLVAGRRKARV